MRRVCPRVNTRGTAAFARERDKMLGAIDESILLFVNQGWGHPCLDPLFVMLSSKNKFAYPVALLILAWSLFTYRKDGLWLWFSMVLAIGLADALGNQLKGMLDGYRPCFEIYQQLRPLPAVGWPCGGSSTGMPSNHTMNFFTGAVFLLLAVKRRRQVPTAALAIACGVGLSRIYLGEHYPSQVLVGGLAGAALGAGLALLARSRFEFAKRIAQAGEQ